MPLNNPPHKRSFTVFDNVANVAAYHRFWVIDTDVDVEHIYILITQPIDGTIVINRGEGVGVLWSAQFMALPASEYCSLPMGYFDNTYSILDVTLGGNEVEKPMSIGCRSTDSLEVNVTATGLNFDFTIMVVYKALERSTTGFV